MYWSVVTESWCCTDDDSVASRENLSRTCVRGRSFSEGRECRVISEQTLACPSLSLAAALYLGQDRRLGLSTLYFKAVLFSMPLMCDSFTALGWQGSREVFFSNASCSVVRLVGEVSLNFLLCFTPNTIHMLQGSNWWPFGCLAAFHNCPCCCYCSWYWACCVTLQSSTLLILNSTYWLSTLLDIAASDRNSNLYTFLPPCLLLFSIQVYLPCFVSLSLNLGQPVPQRHLFSVPLWFWYWLFFSSTLTATSPMFSAGIKNPCRPHLPCEWISYPGFNEISLLPVPPTALAKKHNEPVCSVADKPHPRETEADRRRNEEEGEK